MKTYARIQDGLVAEMLETDSDISQMFNPGLTWVDVAAVAGIAEGWSFDGTTFAPPQPAAPAAAAPSLADLQARLSALSAELQALSASGPATPAS
jgi:hypothetical protein